MKLISLWAPKGGVGKTTLSINLASGYTKRGYTVLLCDTDEQKSAYKLYKKGGVDWECMVGLPEDKPDYDVVIIDHAPGHTKAPTGSFIIVPFRPSALDFEAFTESKKLLAGKKFIPVVNAVDYRNNEEAEVANHFEKTGAFIVKRRTIYSRSYGLGKTVYQSGRLYGAPEARKEIDRLIEVLEND